MPTFNPIYGAISAIALFIVFQVGVSARSKHSGPFAYFHDASAGHTLLKGNKEIDIYFSQPRTVDESLTYLRKAQFQCRHNKNADGSAPVLSSKATKPGPLDANEGHGSQVNCQYQFGGWLPYPQTWIVIVNFDSSGNSISVLPKRLAD